MEIGTDDIENGMLLIGSHIDSPRLDIKQNPLYENGGMAYLDTHYYGGIKKYQWVASPMAIHGVIVKTDVTTVQINIGEKPEDPVVGVTDILVHLSAKQMEKKGSVVIEGEDLDLLVGSQPIDKKEGEKEENPVKAYVLQLLKEQYGIEEKDFVSAELEVVPAGAARDRKRRRNRYACAFPGKYRCRSDQQPGCIFRPETASCPEKLQDAVRRCQCRIRSAVCRSI